MTKKVRIVEVGLRDGLQNEKEAFSLKQKLELFQRLVKSGLNNIEVGAFVSPKWVPQMADTDKLLKKIRPQVFKTKNLSVLVPNETGMRKALSFPVKEVAIFAACSETFSKKNINATIEESFYRFEQVALIAKKHKIKVRGYLSTCFACPYEGKVEISKVVKLSQKLLDMGAYEVSIGDTIGVANPLHTEKLIKALLKKISPKKIAMHFHDTKGMALANISKSLDLGVRSFDASIGGLGGCPYAKGASGNVATEDVVYMLSEMGYSCGVDLNELIKSSKWLQSQLTKTLPSKLSKIALD